MNCHYKIIYYPTQIEQFFHGMKEFNVSVTETYATTLTHLEMGTEYTVNIYSNKASNGETAKLTFKTPCLALKNQLCRKYICIYIFIIKYFSCVCHYTFTYHAPKFYGNQSSFFNKMRGINLSPVLVWCIILGKLLVIQWYVESVLSKL